MSATDANLSPAAASARQRAPVALRCACGRALPLRRNELLCVCGRNLGARQDGLWRIGQPAPYWGEVEEERMADLLSVCRRRNWRSAAEKVLPELAGYLLDARRAAFIEVLPLPPGRRLLEIGAGMGAISAELARDYDVVAMEGVRERAEFLALRAAQDGLERLQVICADWHLIRFAPNQFDGIIMNGVLEWVGLGDRAGSPRAAQLRFLRRAREWLAPDGVIYLAIENRFGLPAWRGSRDHSGLPFTSLLPRWAARLACAFWAPYRSGANRGYRTYTYSYGGYRRLLEQAELKIEQSYVCPLGYNLPVGLMPLHPAALRFQKARRGVARGLSWRAARRRLDWAWLYRALGGDFAFVLSAASPATAAALPSGERNDA